jgi:tetratricopeptide (TPR) repeat protein
MGRWLAAIVLLAGALAAGGIAFLNGGDPLPIRITPARTIALPLGTALALAFATGAALIAFLALGGAVARTFRRSRRRRKTARERAALDRARVRAETLLVQGDADAARTRLTDALAGHGGDERLLELLAGASERSGDVPGAIAAMEDALARQPESPLLARRLRSLYASAGRWDDALALEERVLRTIRSPAATAAEAETLRGLRLEAAAADPDATRRRRRLLTLAREHPGFVAAWVGAGDALRDGGHPIRARRVYERGARARPAVVLLERLAALDAAQGHPERTTKTLERLRRHHPADPSLLGELVRGHLRANALDRAEAALAEWPADGPVVSSIEALRGECSRRQARLEQAAVHFARAAEAWLAPSAFACGHCGQRLPAWQPRCPRCGRWDGVDGLATFAGSIPSADLMPSPSGNTGQDLCVPESPR